VSVLLFVFRDVLFFCSVYALVLLLTPWTGFTYSGLFRKLRPMIISAVVIFFSHGLTAGGEPVTVFYRALPVLTVQGVTLGFYYGMTVVLLSTLSLFVTSTTSPEGMSRGISNLLRPLSRIGLPVAEFARLLAQTIIHVPVILSQVESTCRSYRFRFGGGNVLDRMESGVQSLVELFVLCLRDAMVVVDLNRGGTAPAPVSVDAEKISSNP
jgi:energy-coupling factor transport system permease protein